MLVRLIDPPSASLPLPDHAVVLGRGPFPLAAERRLLAAHRIAVVVSKNSGGAATEGKIVAAREAGLPVVMIDRPPSSPGDRTETVEDALSWIAQPDRKSVVEGKGVSGSGEPGGTRYIKKKKK